MKRAAKLACMIAGAAAAALAFCMPAHADDSLTLTAGQTLALYGTSLTADRYSYGTFIETVTFDYVGKTSDYGSLQYGENCSVLGVYNNAQANLAGVRASINQYDYLIYRCQVQNWENQNALQFVINQPSLLQGITGYSGGVLFGCGASNTYGSDYAYRSNCLFNTTKGSMTFRASANNNNGATVVHIALSAPDSFGTVNNADILAVQYIAMIDPDNVRFNGQEFDLTSFSINWGSAGGIIHSGVTGGYTNLYIMLACPTLYDYEPPVTTAPATSTRPVTTRRQYSVLPPATTAPAYTVDLSNLESGVAAIVEQGVEANNNLDWIGNNVYIGVNNLAYIANRLDDIYSQMQRSGQIPIDSTGELMNDVQSALTSYTTAKIPTDAAAGLTFWAWLMGKITSVAFIGELAAFGAVLAVTYFILFRGRNS